MSLICRSIFQWLFQWLSQTRQTLFVGSASRVAGKYAVLFALSLACACVTYVPVDEWNTARSAYEAAKDADAARYVPSIWFSAEQAYREAQKAYKDRRYSAARDLFSQAKDFCERAENAARLARQQSGEIVP